MADNVLIATANDANGAHQKIVNEYLDAGGLPVSVSIATPLPVLASISTAGLATSTGQTSGNASLTSIDGKTPVLGQQLAAASSPVVLTAAQIAALTPQTNAITDAQIRATALPVSGTFFQATQPVSGTVSTGLSQPLTDTQLRTTPVPVSGTVVTGGLTDAQIRATPLPITSPNDFAPATINITAQDIVSVTTAMANGQSFITGAPTAGSFAAFTLANLDSCVLQVTGTWTGTLSSEISVDGGTTWLLRSVHQAGTEYVQKTFTNNFAGGLNCAGYTNYRVRSSTAWTGTATIKLTGSVNINSIFINNALRLTDPNTSTQMLAISAAGAAKVDGSATTQPVSAVSLPLPTGAATETTLAALNTKVTAVNTGAVTISAALPTGANTIGNVNVNGTVPVSGTFFQGTQPVSAASLPLPTGAATSANQQTNAITDTQIRATPLPISGTVSTGGLTDTQLRATPVPISLATDADNTASGTLSAALQTVVLNVAGKSSAVFKVTNTWVGTITFEGSVDGTLWDSINAVAASTSSPQPTTTVNGSYRLTPAAFFQIRATMSAFTSGTATISARASSATGGIFANQILPSKITDGTNTATIKPASTASAATDLPLVVALHPTSPTPNFLAAQPVTGTFFQGTQPVSIATMPSTPVTGTFFQATQPVSLATNTPTLQSGSTTAVTQATAASLNATVVGTGTFVTQSTLAAETTKVIGTVNVAAAQTIAVTNAGTFAVQAAATLAAETTKVIGTVNVAASQTIATTQATASNLNAQVVGAVASAGANAGNPVKIGGAFNTTQPTVTTGQIVDAQLTARGAQIVATGAETFNATINAALPIGTNTIGAVNIAASQTLATVTTVSAVTAITNALPTGANTIGAVNIAAAQTLATVTTVGAVTAITNQLPTGTNTIGAVNIAAAQTLATVTTVSAVTAITNALPTGANTIGGVNQAGTWTTQIGNTPNTTPILANQLTPAVTTTGDTGAKTATGNGATQTNTTAKGAHIIVNMGAVTGTTPTFVGKIQGSADGGTTFYDLPGATTASLTATGVFGIMVYPGLAVTAGTTTTGTTAQASSSLPRSWRLVWTIGGTTPSFTITNIQVSYLI